MSRLFERDRSTKVSNNYCLLQKRQRVKLKTITRLKIIASDTHVAIVHMPEEVSALLLIRSWFLKIEHTDSWQYFEAKYNKPLGNVSCSYQSMPELTPPFSVLSKMVEDELFFHCIADKRYLSMKGNLDQTV